MAKYIITVDTKSKAWKRTYVYLPKKCVHDRYVGTDTGDHYVKDRSKARQYTSIDKAKANCLPYEVVLKV